MGQSGRLCIPKRAVRAALGLGVRELKQLLTARKAMYKGPDLVARGYEEIEVDGEEWLALPRRLAEALGPGKCANLMGGAPRPMVEGGVPEGAVELFDYQRACVEALEREVFTAQKLAVGAALAYLNLPAGRGKTLVGVEAARRAGGRCAVVAPRRQICEQWRQAFEDHVPGVTAVVAGDLAPAERRAAVAAAGAVVMSPSMALREQETEENYWAQYAMVIIDEAHMMCAASWRQVLERQTAARVLGLSATTSERTDGMDPVAKWHLGEPIMARDLPGYDAMDVEFHGAVRLIDVRDPRLTRRLVGLKHAQAQQELHQYAPWVEAVAAEVEGLLRRHETEDIREGRAPAPPAGEPEEGHNVIVFAEHREAVEVYAAVLRERLGGLVVAPELGPQAPPQAPPQVPPQGPQAPPPQGPQGPPQGPPRAPPEVAGMMGGTDTDAAARAMKEARVIVTTFSYSAVGVSLDRFTAAVMATTRKSQLYQIMSRVLRVRSDTAVRRDYVCFVGPRPNWKVHGSALKACARGLNFAVEVERRAEL